MIISTRRNSWLGHQKRRKRKEKTLPEENIQPISALFSASTDVSHCLFVLQDVSQYTE